MPARKKKGNKGATAKHVAAPVEKVVTRAVSRQVCDQDATKDDQVPPSGQSAEPDTSGTALLRLVTSMDTRMTKMEEAFRSAINNISVVKDVPPVPVVPALSAAPIPAPLPAPLPPVIAAPVQPMPAVPDYPLHQVPSSTVSDSTSSRSSRSTRREPASTRSHSRSLSSVERSRSRSSGRSHRKKSSAGKYDGKYYLEEGDKLDSFERLMLVNLRILSKMYKKDKDLQGFLDHTILLVEKADTDVFEPDTLIRYDHHVKTVAADKGSSTFATLDLLVL